MKTALVGATGFVGSNLAAQVSWTDLYNSSNIDSIKGKSYDRLVLAGIRAEKWKANQNPLSDWESILELMNCLVNVTAKKTVVISTVDVFNNPQGVDEDSKVDMTNLHPYGKHRRLFEEFCQKTFGATIIRLPGLFGKGLKKNIIFDLIHNNRTELIDPTGVFQWYSLNNLWKDILIVLENNLPLVHFATEPVPTQKIINLFPNARVGIPGKNPTRYNLKTKYSGLWGARDGYLYTASQVLGELEDFIAKEGK